LFYHCCLILAADVLQLILILILPSIARVYCITFLGRNTRIFCTAAAT